MTIPSLPLDIVFEIVSHLEEEEKVEQQIQAGRMASLVCRSWRALGQRLRWNSVKTNPATLSSLLNHFAQFPHLAKFIRSFSFAGPGFDNGSGTDDRSSIISTQLPKLLCLLINLHDLSISGNLEEDLVPALKAASSLKNLQSLNMRGYGQFTCSNEFSTTLQTGFKKLQILGFLACGRTSPAALRHDDIEESVSNKLSVSQATIGWSSEPFETPKLANHLDFDAACPTSIQYLSNCPNLTELSLDLSYFSGFSQLLPHFPHFPSLEACRVRAILGGKQIQSPFPLSTLLSSLPPSILIFVAKQLVFSDFSQIPIRQLGTEVDLESRKYVWVGRPSSGTEEGPTKLILWGEEEEGQFRWFRNEARAAQKDR